MSLPLIHVMHVLSDTNVGGAGTLLCNQLAAIDRRRFYFSVVVPRGSRLIDRLRSLDPPCNILLTNHAADRSADPRAIPEYLHLFRTYRPDIVHSHAALSARVAAKLANVPVCIHTRHCVFPLTPWQQTPLYRLGFRVVNTWLSDGTLAVAHAAKRQLCELGMASNDIKVIINGVMPLIPPSAEQITAVRKQLSLPPDSFVIGMVARLEEYKGQKTLLRAAARCVSERDGGRFHFILCGDGSERETLQQLARQLHLDNHVHFVGFCRDVAPYYALMDVNVNASSGTETSSLSLSEGMSLGVPCIASDYGGNPYMVRHEENGLLFPVGDDRALAAALLRMSRDDALRRRLSKGARRHYQAHLTADNMARQMEAYYIDLLSKSKK